MTARDVAPSLFGLRLGRAHGPYEDVHGAPASRPHHAPAREGPGGSACARARDVAAILSEGAAAAPPPAEELDGTFVRGG